MTSTVGTLLLRALRDSVSIGDIVHNISNNNSQGTTTTSPHSQLPNIPCEDTNPTDNHNYCVGSYEQSLKSLEEWYNHGHGKGIYETCAIWVFIMFAGIIIISMAYEFCIHQIKHRYVGKEVGKKLVCVCGRNAPPPLYRQPCLITGVWSFCASAVKIVSSCTPQSLYGWYLQDFKLTRMNTHNSLVCIRIFMIHQ